MKKKIIYSSVLTALLSASSCALAGGPEVVPLPDYFSGFYVGGIGGVHHNTFNGNSQLVLTQPINIVAPPFDAEEQVTINIAPGILNNADLGGGEYDGYGGVQGGFGKVFNRQFYLGIQGWGEWGSSSETDTRSGQLSQSFGLPSDYSFQIDGNANTTTTFKISNDYGLGAKLGWVVAPRSMIYGKVGASWANIKVDNSLTASSNIDAAETLQPKLSAGDSHDPVANIATTLGSSSSSESTKIGLLLGIGFEQFVYEDIVSLNVEGTYTNYGQVSTEGQVTGDSVMSLPRDELTLLIPLRKTNLFSSANTNVQVSTLTAGVNFYFGREWL